MGMNVILIHIKSIDSPIYLAHYTLQDIETFVNRKLLTELYLFMFIQLFIMI